MGTKSSRVHRDPSGVAIEVGGGITPISGHEVAFYHQPSGAVLFWLAFSIRSQAYYYRQSFTTLLTIIALPAAVNFDFVQKSGGFGSEPQPHDPLVMSLYLRHRSSIVRIILRKCLKKYQVVDAQGSPLYIGGQPSHFDSLVMMMLRSRVGGGVEVGNFPKNHPIW